MFLMSKPALLTKCRWHGDIKPDNILRVKGEFKLADFGFTQFKVRTPGAHDPKTQLHGLTRSFGL